MENTIIKNSSKGILISLTVSIIGILLFAFIVKLSCLSYSVIKAVNQFIKVISVFVGCFFSLKENKGLLKGLIVGAIYITILYILFTIMGSNQFSLNFVFDFLFTSVIGGVSGIIIININKKSQN